MADIPEEQHDNAEAQQQGQANAPDQNQQQQDKTQPQSVNKINQVQKQFEQIDKRHQLMNKLKLIFAVAIVVILLAAVGSFYALKYHSTNTITTAATTTAPIVTTVSACGTINAPGSYSLAAIDTRIQSGACINVTASNVRINCNGHSLTGAGPFINTPPFTQAVELSGVRNVSIANCNILNFSYGIYASQSSFVSIQNDTIQPNYMSDVYFSGVTNSTIAYDNIGRSSSTQGAITLANASTNDLVLNNSVQFNAAYGIVVNSTGNRFIKNYINSSRFAFSCGLGYGYPHNNSASANLCYNSTGCAFVSCIGKNIPVNTLAVTLHQLIDRCGTIRNGGNYQLAFDIGMQRYQNVSNPSLLSYNIPCINVAANNVVLDCNHHTISNASYGVLVSYVSNVVVQNCNFKSSSFGVKLVASNYSKVYNVSASNNNVSIAVAASLGVALSNIRSTNSGIGVRMVNASGNKISNFNLTFNKYGLYINGSQGNSFSNGYAFNSSAIDVYASADSSGAGINFAAATSCGASNTKWANCKLQYSPSSFRSVAACMNIAAPGIYQMVGNIITANQNCFTITAPNVYLNCLGDYVTPIGPSSLGTGFIVQNTTNVVIDGCNLQRFRAGLSILGSNNIHVFNSSFYSVNYGISETQSSAITLTNDTVSTYAKTAVQLSASSGTRLVYDNISYGSGNSTALLISNSTNNFIHNNTMSSGFDGLVIVGASRNNNITNNTAQFNTGADFTCIGPNKGFGTEQGGINYGSSKAGCEWLLALQKGQSQISCSSIGPTAAVSITADGIYPYGQSCYTISSNSTTINCNGHTILSTAGGGFAYAQNVTGALIENCKLEGFTNAIASNHSSISVINTTIYGTGTPGSIALLVNTSRNINIRNNNFSQIAIGFSGTHITNGNLYNNTVQNFTTAAYVLYSSSGISINNNMAHGKVGTALILNNSITNRFMSNLFNAKTGIACSGTASVSSNDQDAGNNTCSSNFGCPWITQSSATCH